MDGHIYLPKSYIRARTRSEERPEYYVHDGAAGPLIIANASDVRWRIGADELRDMAREVDAEYPASERAQSAADRAEAYRARWLAYLEGRDRARRGVIVSAPKGR